MTHRGRLSFLFALVTATGCLGVPGDLPTPGGEDGLEDLDAAQQDPDESAVPTPGNTVQPCASNSFWNDGNTPSQLMHPGKACISCHSSVGGPAFTAAGTVYADLNEPDDCNGVSGNVTVELTDSAGVVVRAEVNAAGNFQTAAALAPPLRVKLTSAGKSRIMFSPAPHGNCNACHTQLGDNGAPGRIVAP